MTGQPVKLFRLVLRSVVFEGALDHARDSERRLTELLATAPAETIEAVRAARDRAGRCAERLAVRTAD